MKVILIGAILALGSLASAQAQEAPSSNTYVEPQGISREWETVLGVKQQTGMQVRGCPFSDTGFGGVPRPYCDPQDTSDAKTFWQRQDFYGPNGTGR